MSGMPKVLIGFKSEWYFSGARASLSKYQRLQVEIASIYYSSVDSAKREVETSSTEALKELLKIEKRKGIVGSIITELKKRSKEM
jgi:hypothetical protein